MTRPALFDTDHLRVSETAVLAFLLVGGPLALATLPFALEGQPVFVVFRAVGFLFVVLAALPLLWALLRYRGRLQPVVWLGVAGGAAAAVLVWVTERPL
jgi:hypothetical protein